MINRKIAFVCACLALAGCHEPFSNDDILFLKAAPRGLRIEVPKPHGQGLRAAQSNENTPAKFYLDTRQTAEDINRGILGLLDIVDQAVALEPSVREQDQRIWGPFPASDTHETALVVGRVRTATVVRFTSTSTLTAADQYFDYALLARRKGTGDEGWFPLFSGRSIPQVSNRQGTGLMFLDLDAFRALDRNAEGRGLIFLGYDTRFGQTTIELYADPVRTGPFEPKTAWLYSEDGTGGGDFLFFIRQNLVEATAAEELLGVAARWVPDGRGRADVVVTEGDVAGFYFASECWDIRFTRVYLASNIPDSEFSPEGRIELCGRDLQDPLFPDD